MGGFVDDFLVFVGQLVWIFFNDFVENVNVGIGMQLFVFVCLGDDVVCIFQQIFEVSEGQYGGKLIEE